MKRRNFVSGLLAAPLALKARLARFFACKPAERKPVEFCGAAIFGCGGPFCETPTASNPKDFGRVQRKAWATICAEARQESEREKLPGMKLLNSLARAQNLRVAFASLGIINYQPAGYHSGGTANNEVNQAPAQDSGQKANTSGTNLVNPSY